MPEYTFILTLVAVLIAFVLLYLRTARFEVYLKEIKGLRNLNDRIRGLNEAMERINTAPMEECLFELRERAGRVVELLEKREQDMRTQARDDLRTSLEAVLYGMGYEQVRILGDLADATGADQVEIRVECMKDDVVHKGAVTVQAGSVVECRIRPAYEVFP